MVPALLILVVAGILNIPQAFFLRWAASLVAKVNLYFRDAYTIYLIVMALCALLGALTGIAVASTGMLEARLRWATPTYLLLYGCVLDVLVASGVNAVAIKNVTLEKPLGLVLGFKIAVTHVVIATVVCGVVGLTVGLPVLFFLR
jgi:hypothetical protein